MKKFKCDRCGAVGELPPNIPGLPEDWNNIRAVSDDEVETVSNNIVCENCLKDFYRWLKNKASVEKAPAL